MRLIQGDCREILPTLSGIDAVVTDPPYGIDHDTDYTRFTNKYGLNREHAAIEGDAAPFDPAPLLRFPRQVIFGFNCFSNRLPIGSLLVWCKRRDSMFGKFLADCEVAWMGQGHGVYIFQHEWHGALKESEKGQSRHHPSQKPTAVMRWCIEKLNLAPGSTILDPYMGSGSTGVAAIQSGHNFIGIEIDPAYVAVARRRIRDAETPLFAAPVVP